MVYHVSDYIAQEEPEFDKWLKAQNYIPEREEEERIRFKESCVKHIQKLNKSILEEDIEEIKGDLLVIQQKSKDQIKFSSQFDLSKQWEELFNSTSYNNEIIGKIFFRVLLSTLLKNKEIFKKNGTKLNMILHHFAIQSTGSGKDQAFDLLMDVCEEINRQREGLVRIYELSGAETMESLLTHFAEEKNGKFNYDKVVAGIFEKSDIIISRECSFMFVEKRGEKQTKSELFLIALEGRKIEKSLKSWEGHSTITAPNFCFIGTTRPIENMKKHIVSSGLQQRGINYMRDLDVDTRLKMMSKVCNNTFGSASHMKNRKTKITKFVENLLRLYDFALATEIKIEDEKELNEVLYKNLRIMFEDINNSLSIEEHKDILFSFLARFTDIILILSYQNAILRGSDKVSVIDLQTAIDDIIKGTMTQLKVWVEQTIEEDKGKVFKNKMYVGVVNKYFADKVETKLKPLAQQLEQSCSISISHAYYILRKLCNGNKSMLKYDEEKKILVMRDK